MIRTLMIAAAVAALAACQPAAQKDLTAAPAPAEEAAAAKTGLELLEDENSATLHSWSNAEMPDLTLTCVRDSKTISLSADLKQFQNGLQPGKGAMIASGASFEDEAMISTVLDQQMVQLTVAMTPDALKAVSTATTVRLAVADSFGETDVDGGDTFEKFAAKCASLNAMTLSP